MKSTMMSSPLLVTNIFLSAPGSSSLALRSSPPARMVRVAGIRCATCIDARANCQLLCRGQVLSREIGSPPSCGMSRSIWNHISGFRQWEPFCTPSICDCTRMSSPASSTTPKIAS